MKAELQTSRKTRCGKQEEKKESEDCRVLELHFHGNEAQSRPCNNPNEHFTFIYKKGSRKKQGMSILFYL